MTFTDAAAEVLRLIGRPLHYKEITDIAIEKNLLSHVGKSPEVTMGARLAATLKKESPDNPLVRVKPGVFALREWDEKTIRSGLDGKKGKKGSRPDAGRARGKGDAGDEPVAEDTEALDEIAIDETEEPGADEEPAFAHADADDEHMPVVEPEQDDEPAVVVPPARPSPAPARILT